jgi:hypothetical protein
MSKSITITLSHDLGAEEARHRIETGLDALRRRFADKIGNASVTWTGNHADVHVAAMGQSVDAGVDVAADIVTIELRLPWLLAAFAEKVRGFIEKSGTDALRLPPPSA